MSVDLLRAIELAAVRGWPALEQRVVDGWVWRYASGGSIRANSVAALDWRGTDLTGSIEACEALARARGAPCVFTVSDVSLPVDLDACLADRGYARGDDHVTMAKAVPSLQSSTTEPSADLGPHVHASALPTVAWMVTYLSGLAEDRRGVARQLIANLPRHALFVSVHAGGDARQPVISSGLTIADGSLASVQCMATLPGHRRQGGAWQVLAAIETSAQRHGATHLYLQTGGDNAGAQALYAKFGFSVVGRYHTRTRRDL